jgi:hypothetical protein
MLFAYANAICCALTVGERRSRVCAESGAEMATQAARAAIERVRIIGGSSWRATAGERLLVVYA